MKRKGIPLILVLVCALAAIMLAQAPTVIQPTDLLVNSRGTINTNFANLYTGQPTLIDCSGTAGRFVVTLNGGGTASVCATLTWANILALSGTPATFVTSFNSRSGAVTLQSSDVATVEQDLRNTASPNFVNLGLGGTLAVTGTSIFTGAITANGGISGSGAWTGGIIGPTYGGTGVNNGSFTLTLASNVTGPSTTGTLVGSGDTGTVTNAMLAGSIVGSKLTGTITGTGTSALNGIVGSAATGYAVYGNATGSGGIGGYFTATSSATTALSAVGLVSLSGGSASPAVSVTNTSTGQALNATGSVAEALGSSFGCTHGSNATCGMAQLSSGTVTVSTTAACTLATSTTGCAISLTEQGHTNAGFLSLGTVTNGSSFVIDSSNASDANYVFWEIKQIF